MPPAQEPNVAPSMWWEPLTPAPLIPTSCRHVNTPADGRNWLRAQFKESGTIKCKCRSFTVYKRSVWGATKSKFPLFLSRFTVLNHQWKHKHKILISSHFNTSSCRPIFIWTSNTESQQNIQLQPRRKEKLHSLNS